MLNNQSARIEQGHRRSCMSYGCMTIVVAFLFLAAWIGSGFIIWKQCRIPLPDGSGSVIYMARLNKIFCAEWDRKVCIEINGIKSKKLWLPGDGGGGDPVNVYWYPSVDGKGAYLRFEDPLSGCYVDIKHRKTLGVCNREGNVIYVGELLSSLPKKRFVENKKTGDFAYTLDGHPLHKLESYVASSPGICIGRIEYPFNRFISKKEAPEEPLPDH